MYPSLLLDLCRQSMNEHLAEAERTRLATCIVRERVLQTQRQHLEAALGRSIFRWGLWVRVQLTLLLGIQRPSFAQPQADSPVALPAQLMTEKMVRCSPLPNTSSGTLFSKQAGGTKAVSSPLRTAPRVEEREKCDEDGSYDPAFTLRNWSREGPGSPAGFWAYNPAGRRAPRIRGQ